MQAAKLRARLAEYYESEGRTDPLGISIPKGGYVPTFTGAAASPATPARSDPAADVQSIAVLPFVNMSGEADNEYFSDGLTEVLINLFTSVPRLRVVARTSVFSVEILRRVLEIDPNYAPAWAGLASTYLMPPNQALQLAK